MAKGAKKTTLSSREEKEQLFAELADGRLSIGQATKRMRKIVGLTQTEYAEKVLKNKLFQLTQTPALNRTRP